MRRSTASALIGGKRPCGGSVCSSCRQDISFPVITRRWGKLGITAHRGFIALLDRVFGDMKKENPSLLSRISSAGGVCCRLVRRASGGCGRGYSIHSYGFAVDLKVDGYLDRHGDGCVHKPLFEIHKFMSRYGIYWGKDFSTEDAMHWEVSNQVGQKWLREGVPRPGSSISPVEPPKSRCQTKHGDKAVCKNESTCTGTTTVGLCPGPKAIKCCYNEKAPEPVPEKCVVQFGKEAKCVAASECKTVNKGDALCSAAGKVCCTPDLCAAAKGGKAKCVTTGECGDGKVVPDLCSPGTSCCVPLEDTPPKGSISITKEGKVQGYACDVDSPDVGTDVHIYIGGKAGAASAKVTSLKASCPQCLAKPATPKPAECQCVGDCLVAFEVDIGLVDGLAEFSGKSVAMFAYAINEGSAVGQTVELKDSPVTIEVPAVIPPAQVSDDEGIQLYEPKALPACFSPDACDSSQACCAYCSPLPAGSACMPASADGCKKDAYCDGINAYCPSRERKAEGEPCDDGDPCTGPDKCSLDGTCFGQRTSSPECKCTSDAQCDDGHACTKGTCDTATGQCQFAADPAAAGKLCRRSRGQLSCDFEEFCTGESAECPEDAQGCLRMEFEGDEDPGVSELDGTPAPSDNAAAMTCSAFIVAVAFAALMN